MALASSKGLRLFFGIYAVSEKNFKAGSCASALFTWHLSIPVDSVRRYSQSPFSSRSDSVRGALPWSGS